MKKIILLLFLCSFWFISNSVEARQLLSKDMTSYIKNPGFNSSDAEKAMEGWTVEHVESGNITPGPLGEENENLMINALGTYNGCFESWHCYDFNVWQELTGLPAGIYSLTAQGFVRCEAPDYNRGDKLDPARIPIKFYMNDYTATFPNVYSESLEDLGHSLTNVEAWTVETINDKQYPNSMGGAAQCFSWGMYKVELIAVVNPGETVRIGVRGKTDEDWWCIWDNFQLKYLGAADENRLEIAINHEREIGLGYTPTEEEVDFTTAKSWLGVDATAECGIVLFSIIGRSGCRRAEPLQTDGN